jgi:hypothetical protein
VSDVFASAQIAQSIADHLRLAIPEPVTVTAFGPALHIEDGQSSAEVDLSAFGEHGLLSARDAETATRAALSTIQDSVQEALRVPWPALDALPDAVVRDGILAAWFGSQEAPTLRLNAVASSVAS